MRKSSAPRTMMPSCSLSAWWWRNEPVAPPAMRQKHSCSWSPVMTRRRNPVRSVSSNDASSKKWQYWSDEPVHRASSTLARARSRRSVPARDRQIEGADDRLVLLGAPLGRRARATSPRTRARRDHGRTGSCWRRGPTHPTSAPAVERAARASVVEVRRACATSQAMWYIPTARGPPSTASALGADREEGDVVVVGARPAPRMNTNGPLGSSMTVVEAEHVGVEAPGVAERRGRRAPRGSFR